ncbi:hypothetical protein BDB00DRAFT_802323 [Zychaea mexicana]|uniref:uncharacterized protein n=1 Tax=Zychaea mexicana TaxID=64656 RepID=UPI0022FE3376|nr:uncharacterized protein BDB00DRAFT_802323 [Zychaea mexicana]KAI9497876.1 hypothetical protein BDB00DRAFT_802323 [Zychaea mexicana]
MHFVFSRGHSTVTNEAQTVKKMEWQRKQTFYLGAVCFPHGFFFISSNLHCVYGGGLLYINAKSIFMHLFMYLLNPPTSSVLGNYNMSRKRSCIIFIFTGR